ncbi:MAG: tryptophan--tRNA ligase [Bacteriovorax sp.]|nr:tryptophan--tRNA ligase [Bacteriovorax sp.]
MSKKICLTGVKPTGMPHLGNYIGAIKPAIEMANSGLYDSYYFIADYHSLINVHDAKVLKNYIYEVAATWLAMGLDPKSVTLYKQSDVPEILELNWIVNCFTSKGLMNRAHAYKAMVQENEKESRDKDAGVNMGLFSYPVLMACDIMILSADVVPVGADQLQHIEIARDIAHSFNSIYVKDYEKLRQKSPDSKYKIKGSILTPPEAIVAEGNKLLAGLDGRKMSKSYNNHIPLFSTEKELQKLINKIMTDSSGPTESKNPDDSLIYDFYQTFATPAEAEDLRTRYLKGIGWGEAKADLLKVLNEMLKDPREIYNALMADTKKIDLILEEGAARVRPHAQSLIKDIKKTIGVL